MARLSCLCSFHSGVLHAVSMYLILQLTPRQHACPRGCSADIVVLYIRDEERQVSSFSGCAVQSHEIYVLEFTYFLSLNGLVYGSFRSCRPGFGPGLLAGDIAEFQSARRE